MPMPPDHVSGDSLSRQAEALTPEEVMDGIERYCHRPNQNPETRLVADLLLCRLYRMVRDDPAFRHGWHRIMPTVIAAGLACVMQTRGAGIYHVHLHHLLSATTPAAWAILT